MSYLGNAPGVESQRLAESFTATNGQTTFQPSGGYTLGYVDVYLNGVKLLDGSDYTASDGINVVLTSGASLSDNVELVTYTPRGLSDGYTKSEADTRYARLNEDATFGALTSTGIDDNATSTRVTVSDSGVDVTGTVTADGLSIQGSAVINGVANANLQLQSTGGNIYQVRTDTNDVSIHQAQRNAPIAKFTYGGDVQFYEDTGTTAKFHWDSSAESLGIGGSPSSALTVISDSSADETVLTIGNNYSTADAAGDSSGMMFQLYRSYAPSLNDAAFIKAEKEQAWDESGGRDSALTFGTRSGGVEPTERMRLDSSGNLLVGTTTIDVYNSTDSGVAVTGSGYIFAGKANDAPMYLNRISSDGSIIQFNKNGSTVGSISTVAGNIAIGNGNTSVYISNATDSLTPTSLLTGTPVERDAGIDIGRSTARFKDLYLSGGVYLGGTGSANKLDDYETGNWTPVVERASGFTASGAVAGTSKYTKIGRQVTLEFELSMLNSSGSVTVGDDFNLTSGCLPFTPLENGHAVGTIGVQSGMLTAIDVAMGYAGFSGVNTLGLIIHTVDGTVNRDAILGGVITYYTND